MAGTHQQFLDHIVLSTKNRQPYLSAGHRNEVFVYMLNMTFDISGSSDTKCVALSGLRYTLGNRSGALRHPAGVVRTLRAQDGKRLLNTNCKLIVHVRGFNRSSNTHEITPSFRGIPKANCRKTRNNWGSYFVSVTSVAHVSASHLSVRLARPRHPLKLARTTHQ
jgi:hypothetical protein